MKSQRFFRMSVINAIAEVRTFRKEHGIATTKECCRLLRIRPGAAASFDYDAVEQIDPVFELYDEAPVAREQTLRSILRALIFHYRPHWGLLLPHGRRVLRLNTTPDVRQCFETAGFFNDSPDEESIHWWDELSNYFRSVAVLGRVEIGRRGEMLSLNYERQRLSAAGHGTLEPTWAAIEDETLGYDLVSFNVSSGAPHPVYIEVKASERTPFIFFLTEHEWKVAQSSKESYLFHFWDLSKKSLRVATVDEVAAHIPLNQGVGVWKKAQILWV